jgi:hypothetical protein
MENYNGVQCVTAYELIKSPDNPNGIITKSNYDNLSQRGRIRVIRRGCFDTPALIEWSSLPDRFKSQLREQGISPENKESGFSKMVQVDMDARDFYADYVLADGRWLPDEKQAEYSNNAEVLNAVQHLINDRKALRKALGGSTRNIWPKIAEQTADLRPKLDENGKVIKEGILHTLPDNHRRLSDRLTKYKNGSYESLISRKWLNRNAKKVVDSEQEATLRQLLRKHNNFDNVQVRDLYNMIAEKVDWDIISASTVGNYRKKWNLDIYGGRRGEKAFDNAKAMLVKRKAPTLPLVYWTVDGWDVELLYQKTGIDSNGNSRTTYHNRLTVVVVLDPSFKYPVGYAIGQRETPTLIREALRNAVNHTAELFGTRHKVGQLQTDRYSVKSLKPFYEAISDKFTPARAHNSKAKVIEPYFKRLNKKFCQLMPNWSGFGVTANKKSQPNSEYLNKIRKSFPDEDGCRIQIDRMIELERAAVQQKYIAAYAELPSGERLTITEGEYLHLLGEKTGFTNRISAMGIVASIAGQKREFDSFDPKFRKLAHVDWTLKFDPNEPERVLAENIDGTLRFMLQEKYEQPMALRDRKEGDADQLRLVRGFNKEMKSEILELMGSDHQIVDELFDTNPKLNDTLTKLVLTDSNGQHKNNKSQSRLAAATHNDEKQSEWEAQQSEYLNDKVDIDKYL